jgi:hypothetical protein
VDNSIFPDFKAYAGCSEDNIVIGIIHEAFAIGRIAEDDELIMSMKRTMGNFVGDGNRILPIRIQ